MKGLTKILVRNVAAAAGIALLLLALNLAVLLGWASASQENHIWSLSVSDIADGLTGRNGAYRLSASAESALHSHFQWGMLLDNSGRVIWEENLPADLPRSYSVPETASFTRWFLQDYPTFVWRHPNGLLVLGSPKSSQWKAQIVLPESVMEQSPAWISVALIINLAAALLLALFAGLRLYRALKPVVGGIGSLAGGKAVQLQEKGIFGDLFAVLNQTSAKLAAQDEALSKRDAARTVWIAGVSHDIRTPLSLVMGYASELEEANLPEPMREKAGVIRAQSEKIRTLVSDLNLASKLEYGMQPLRKLPVYPAELLRNCTVEFLNSGLDTRYSLQLGIAPEAQKVQLFGDAELLHRAFSNLISNSIGHNPDGCTVSVSLEADANLCVFRVADDGAGYPADVLKFLRSEKPSEELHSHGLGLIIVRQIVRLHGGTIRFANLTGRGCECIIQLPVIYPQHRDLEDAENRDEHN
jgi:signal transduction histidine kinase